MLKSKFFTILFILLLMIIIIILFFNTGLFGRKANDGIDNVKNATKNTVNNAKNSIKTKVKKNVDTSSITSNDTTNNSNTNNNETTTINTNNNSSNNNETTNNQVNVGNLSYDEEIKDYNFTNILGDNNKSLNIKAIDCIRLDDMYETSNRIYCLDQDYNLRYIDLVYLDNTIVANNIVEIKKNNNKIEALYKDNYNIVKEDIFINYNKV